MSGQFLHPLARQAVAISATEGAHSWAWGLTKYLAHYDPFDCVAWTLKQLVPFESASEEHNEVMRHSRSVLVGAIADHDSAMCKVIEDTAWQPWCLRGSVAMGNPLARLMWAVMGAVELVRPGWLADSDRFGQCDGNTSLRDTAIQLVWQQCATALHLIHSDFPGASLRIAHSFTEKVTHLTCPSEASCVQQYSWSWEHIEYNISVLQNSEDAYYIEFNDRAVSQTAYAGPFSSLQAVEIDSGLLMYQPKKLVITRIT